MSMFRAVTASSQSIPNLTNTELTFGTEINDPDNGFASNRFTVPASWNGKVGKLAVGFRPTSAVQYSIINIQVSTDGGSNWTTIATNQGGATSASLYSTTATTPIIVFTEGHIYRATIFANSCTKEFNNKNFFSGWYIPDETTKLGLCRLEQSASAQSIPSSTLTTLILDSVVFDTHSMGGSNRITIPADFDGGYAVVSSSLHMIGIERATTFISLNGTTQSQHSINSRNQIANFAGAFQVSTGDYFQQHVFRTEFGTQTTHNEPVTNLCAVVWKP